MKIQIQENNFMVEERQFSMEKTMINYYVANKFDKTMVALIDYEGGFIALRDSRENDFKIQFSAYRKLGRKMQGPFVFTSPLALMPYFIVGDFGFDLTTVRQTIIFSTSKNMTNTVTRTVEYIPDGQDNMEDIITTPVEWVDVPTIEGDTITLKGAALLF